MTNIITLAKQEVAAALIAGGIIAKDYIPERIQPPMAVLAAGNPFIEKGQTQTFTDVEMRLDISLIAQNATNVKSTEELEGLIVDALLALKGVNWEIESVSQPFGLEANNALYLAATLTVTASITIKEVV
jgi:hypothetical protein